VDRRRPRTGRVARTRRLLLPGGSPLARASDRLEGVLVLLFVLLAAAPLLLVQPAQRALEQRLVAAAEAETAGRVRVTATLLDDAAPPVAQTGDPASTSVVAQVVEAAWTDQGGVPRRGGVPVGSSARAGDRVVVWVDGGTAVVEPGPGELSDLAWLQAVLAVLTWWCCLMTAHLVAEAALGVRRDRWWTAQWELVEPRWTSRR